MTNCKSETPKVKYKISTKIVVMYDTDMNESAKQLQKYVNQGFKIGSVEDAGHGSNGEWYNGVKFNLIKETKKRKTR